MKISKKFFILLIGLSLLSSCTVAPLTGRKQLKLVSDESVVESSVAEYKQFISQANSKGLIVNNTTDGKRLKNIGNKIATAVETYLKQNNLSNKINSLQWEFNLIKSNEINAFAMPGGKIAFYTGIIPILQTDSGIAFVMGHEIGHVIGGHHAEGESGKIAAGVASAITDAFTGGNGNIISSLVSDGLSIGLLKFNRTQEYEADKYGMIFMAMAGYNPEDAIKAEERMLAAEKGGRSVEILSTHPDTKKRIEELKKYLPEAMKYYKK